MLIIVGVAAGTVAALTWTAEETFYDEDAFVDNYDSLAADDSLRERLANGITEQMMLLSDLAIEGRLDELGSLEDLGIEGEINEADENALAEAIRAEQRAVIFEAAEEVVNEASFPDVFNNAVRDSHESLLDAFADESELITSDTGVMEINLSPLFGPVQTRIADQPVTVPVSGVAVPRAFGDFKVLDKTTTFDWVWAIFHNALEWKNLLIGISIVTLILSLAISDRRPWVLITFGTAIASVAAVIVVVGLVVFALIPLLVDVSETSGLVASVYRRTISPFVRTEIYVIAGGVALAVLGVVARWIWPDDWVYEHHDTGGGPVAVQTAYPTQVFPQYPQQYAPQPQQLPQAPVVRPAQQTAEPFANPAPQQQPQPQRSLPSPPAERASGSGDGDKPDGWDYDGEW